MTEPRSVPPELWAQVHRRWALSDTLSTLGRRTCLLTSVCAIANAWLAPPSWGVPVLVRLVAPLFMLGATLGVAGLVIAERALRRARRLMIEYHGRDPEAP